MKAATTPRAVGEMRLRVIDHDARPGRVVPATALPSLLSSGDLVVLNDAATIPASFATKTEGGEDVEIRLAAETDNPALGTLAFRAVLFGALDFRTPTERRPRPPRLVAGDRLNIGALIATITSVSSSSTRLVELAFHVEGGPSGDLAAVWAALYRAGRPVQYAHVPVPLPLWEVQNPWARRPWAVEMPSAGRALSMTTLLALRARAIEVVTITHAAGLSATGDPILDEMLPLPERFCVSAEAAMAVRVARERSRRVLAVGTSTVRALEAAARASQPGSIAAASGVTALRLGDGERREVVDGVLTGIHEQGTSHFALLEAFRGRAVLDAAREADEREGLLGHELGDGWLVWAPLRERSAKVAA